MLAAGVALALLLLNVLDYREARTVKMVVALVLGSFLFWLKSRGAHGKMGDNHCPEALTDDSRGQPTRSDSLFEVVVSCLENGPSSRFVVP